MLNLLLNHSPVFVLGEALLALCLAMFSVALVDAVRDSYSATVRAPALRDRSRMADRAERATQR